MSVEKHEGYFEYTIEKMVYPKDRPAVFSEIGNQEEVITFKANRRKVILENG